MVNIGVYWTVSVLCTGMVAGHGFLVDPPARNSMWRYGFDTPKNYDDMGLNCGGAGVQWDTNGGKCGLCGDSFSGSRDHETGGRYAPINRPIVKCYRKGTQTIPITVKLTSYHKGYFEFILCENNDKSMDPGQDCVINGKPLTITGSQGKTRYDINLSRQMEYEFALDLPDVTCTQCILRWKYNTGNSWGCDGSECGMGFGKQEQFINCADIAVLEDCSGMPTVKPQWTGTTPSAGGGGKDVDTTPMTSLQSSTKGTTKSGDTKMTTRQTQTTERPTEGTTESDDVICVPSVTYRDTPGMTDWCNANCPSEKYCPSTHCVCN